MEIKDLIIKTVKIGDKKEGITNNKKWMLWNISLYNGETWYSGAVFSQEEKDKLEALKSGDKLTIKAYKEEYNGKMYDKWKMPNENDKLNARIDRLEKAMTKVFNTFKKELQ